MGMLDALKKIGTRETAQSEKILGSTQVPAETAWTPPSQRLIKVPSS